MMFGVAEDVKPHQDGAVDIEGARREVRVHQPGEDGLFRHRRRMDRYQTRHRRRVRHGVDPRCCTPTNRSRYQCVQRLAGDTGPKADDGLFARGADGEPLCWDNNTGQVADARLAGVAPKVIGEVTLDDGRIAVPAFQLMADRYMDTNYGPEVAALRSGVPAHHIRRIAAELAEAAFDKEIVLDVEWTDWAGRTQDKMIGRPVAMHAMRGISAHSNGFHTCRAIHVLQMLLGTIDVPGGFRPPPFRLPPPQNWPASRDRSARYTAARPATGIPDWA